jgi:hypothetical protein
VQPDTDTFRALARSSPLRWRTLHFTRRSDTGRSDTGRSDTGRSDTGEVEAWLRRPGELLVRLADGSDHYESGAPYTVTRVALRSTPDGREAVDAWKEVDADPEPTFRPDGLVEERPEDYHLEHGDPMWQNYTWIAMLDPEELSHDVEVEDVAIGELHGREVWSARLCPVEGYEPRCGCCALLWSDVAAVGEYGDAPDRLARFRAEGFPDAFDVALDAQTGVVVSLAPVGRDPHDSAFTVEIHEVDGDLDAVFAGRQPR